MKIKYKESTKNLLQQIETNTREIIKANDTIQSKAAEIFNLIADIKKFCEEKE